MMYLKICLLSIKVTLKLLEGFCCSFITLLLKTTGHLYISYYFIFQLIAPVFVHSLCIYKYKGQLNKCEGLGCLKKKWNACWLGDTESRCELANSPTCTLHLHTMIHKTLGLKLLSVCSSMLLQQQSRHFPDCESKYLEIFRLTYTKNPTKHNFDSTPRCCVNNNRILPY